MRQHKQADFGKGSEQGMDKSGEQQQLPIPKGTGGRTLV